MDAAYEGMQKRTFLAMAIMIASHLPFLVIFIVIYHKLGSPKGKIEDTTSEKSEDSDNYY